jgi:hypothetical protein
MCSSLQFSRKYTLSILTGIVLCSTALSSGCNSYSKKQNDHPNMAEGTQAALQKHHDHPNTAEGTQAAVKEIVAVVEKSLADLPPPSSAPAVCEHEMTKLREILKTAPGTADAANANSALLRCTSKATNETKCKGKPQPCGVVYYNPPIKPPDPGQSAPEPSEPKAVDVSVPDQIAAACREIAGAGGAVLSTSAAADPATGVVLGSMAGSYSCGAWFKAAASNDPTLLIAPGFVPTIQLIRDLKTYTNGVVDVTPEAVLANTVKRVDYTLLTIRVGGTIVPILVLPIVPVGGTPGQVLDGAHKTAQQRVNQVGKAVEDGCKALGICH